MYKLVVLCAFLAIATADPDVLLTSPGFTTYVAPASTTITKQASSVIHPSPLVYNAPVLYSHYIKKRSPQLPLSYVAPTTYYASSPWATTYTTPYLQTASVVPAGTLPLAHLIKKRSASLLSTAYLAPTTYSAATPLVSTYSSPLISSRIPW